MLTTHETGMIIIQYQIKYLGRLLSKVADELLGSQQSRIWNSCVFFC